MCIKFSDAHTACSLDALNTLIRKRAGLGDRIEQNLLNPEIDTASKQKALLPPRSLQASMWLVVAAMSVCGEYGL